MRINNMIKNYSLFLLALLSLTQAMGQIQTAGTGSTTVGGSGISGIPGNGTLSGNLSSPQTFMTLSARGGWKLPEFATTEGSPFLHSEYNTAFVRVKSGFTSGNVQVKFNIYGNEIIFIQNGNEMALDSVDFVSYTTMGKNGDIETIKLKTGFPAVNGHSTSSIYQLLDSGTKVQLLKYSFQKTEEVRRFGETTHKEFVTYQELYVNSTSGGMKKIKTDLKSLQEALPEYAAQLDKIVNEKKLKIKRESDLILLIEELNKQPKAF